MSFVTAFEFPMPEPRESYISDILKPPARARRQRKARRTVNWKSSSTPRTLMYQARVRWLLEHSDEGMTIKELAADLGISRQLMLYHVKKMAATGQIVLVFEPCAENGGLRLRTWNHMQLVMNLRVAA